LTKEPDMRATHKIVATFLAGNVTLLVGCADAGARSGTTATRDSAGIAIVENTGPAWTEGRGWKVVDSPMVDVGDVDHVLGPVRLGDGRLAIANAGTSEIRIYDASGALLKSSGRVGSGPGEYQNLVGIWAGRGDSVLVSDIRVRRLTVLDRDGSPGRSLSLGNAGGGFTSIGGSVDFAVPQGWLADGSIVGLSQTFNMSSLNEAREGTFRDTITMIRYGPDGSARDTLGRFPGPETEKVTLTVFGRTMSAPMPVPLGKQFVATARGNRVYVAVNDAWEIEVRDGDGTLKRLIRTAATPVAITPNDVTANRKELRDQMELQPMMRSVPEPMKKQLTARIDQAKYPAAFAFFAGLLADGAGNLWALEVSSGADKTERYAVIDSTGRLLGRVTMPVSFRTSSIGPDAVFGVWKDADDVEHVRTYPLRKGPAN
jgi:hypothetical protein